MQHRPNPFKCACYAEAADTAQEQLPCPQPTLSWASAKRALNLISSYFCFILLLCFINLLRCSREFAAEVSCDSELAVNGGEYCSLMP